MVAVFMVSDFIFPLVKLSARLHFVNNVSDDQELFKTATILCFFLLGFYIYITLFGRDKSLTYVFKLWHKYIECNACTSLIINFFSFKFSA